jgi:threonine synthase
VRQAPPDLILLDLMMPKLDGFGLLDALKADERLKEVPIIVVTARDLTAYERQRLSGRVRALWRKGSFLSTDLLEDIEAVLK